MQANCPNCQNRIVIDDSKVPDRAFSVKCPKCQTVVKFPGRAAPAAAPHAAAPASTGAEPSAAAPPSEEARAQMAAQVKRDMPLESGRNAPRALVALHDASQSAALPLGRLGFQVDTLDTPDEGARLLEQGVYDLVITNRAAGAAGKESLFQRIGRLSPDGRRRLFVIVVGDEFKTGDGTQAWSNLADLVVNTRDAANADAAIANTISERARLYQVFLDARRRHEQAGA